MEIFKPRVIANFSVARTIKHTCIIYFFNVKCTTPTLRIYIDTQNGRPVNHIDKKILGNSLLKYVRYKSLMTQ